MEKSAGVNPELSAQPSIQNALAMLASFKSQGADSSQQTPIGNPQRNLIPIPVINHQLAANQTNYQMIGGSADGGSLGADITGQPLASELQTHSGISERRAGKLPMNTYTASILEQSGAQAIGKGPLGFPPVQMTQMPASRNFSHRQMPVIMQPHLLQGPRHDASIERSVQLESTHPAGQDSAYPPTAPHAGKFDCKSQMPLTGVRVGVLDGLDHVTYKTHVPASYLQWMQQAAKAHRVVGANPPPNRSSKEVPKGSETSGIRRDLENVRIEPPWNSPNSAYTNAVEEGNVTEGENNEVFWRKA